MPVEVWIVVGFQMSVVFANRGIIDPAFLSKFFHLQLSSNNFIGLKAAVVTLLFSLSGLAVYPYLSPGHA